MKSLIESILDDQDDIIDAVEETAEIALIVKQMRPVFDKFLKDPSNER